MEDRRNRIKKYAFSDENVIAWTGENKPKTLVWANIFCFVFVETKTHYCSRELERRKHGSYVKMY